MPMKPGYGPSTISANIRREKKHGYPQNEAIAMAMDQARQSAEKSDKPPARRARRKLKK